MFEYESNLMFLGVSFIMLIMTEKKFLRFFLFRQPLVKNGFKNDHIGILTLRLLINEWG